MKYMCTTVVFFTELIHGKNTYVHLPPRQFFKAVIFWVSCVAECLRSISVDVPQVHWCLLGQLLLAPPTMRAIHITKDPT